jgi:hypothetical protein
MLRRLTMALAAVAALAWCCLLFGIGLDDLADGDTKPGVVFSIVVVSLGIGGLLYLGWRMFGPARDRRASRR